MKTLHTQAGIRFALGFICGAIICGTLAWFSRAHFIKTAIQISPHTAQNELVNGIAEHALTAQQQDSLQKSTARVAEHPTDASALTGLANLEFQVGMYAAAEQHYIQALAVDDSYEGALLGMGNLLRYRGRYEESEVMFKKALSHTPSLGMVYVELGKLYRNWNKYPEAESSFKKALELDPRNDTLYSYGLGYLYRDEGKLDKAVAMFQKAVELNPKNDFNYMGLGDIYRDTGNFVESEKNFKKALSMNPRSEAYLGMGYLYLKQKKLSEAERAFTDYLEKIKPKAEVYSGLGYVYIEQQKFVQAESAFKKSIELNPTLGGWEGLAEVYAATGRDEESEAARQQDKNAKEIAGVN